MAFGLSAPPQSSHRGTRPVSAKARSRPDVGTTRRQRTHVASRRWPWISPTECDPARACRLSMFCVTTPSRRPARSSRANARWAGFGPAHNTLVAKGRTHSKNLSGWWRKARSEATSIGSYFSHRPLPAERKSGAPGGVERPAPVSATARRLARKRRAALARSGADRALSTAGLTHDGLEETAGDVGGELLELVGHQAVGLHGDDRHAALRGLMRLLGSRGDDPGQREGEIGFHLAPGDLQAGGLSQHQDERHLALADAAPLELVDQSPGEGRGREDGVNDEQHPAALLEHRPCRAAAP